MANIAFCTFEDVFLPQIFSILILLVSSGAGLVLIGWSGRAWPGHPDQGRTVP